MSIYVSFIFINVYQTDKSYNVVNSITSLVYQSLMMTPMAFKDVAL